MWGLQKTQTIWQYRLRVQVAYKPHPLPGLCPALDHWTRLLPLTVPAPAHVLRVDLTSWFSLSSSSSSFIPGSQWAFLTDYCSGQSEMQLLPILAHPSFPPVGVPDLSPPRPLCAATAWHQGPGTLRINSEKQKVIVMATHQRAFKKHE